MTGSVRRLRAAVAVALASLLLVTGCSDDEPVPQVVEPTESASPSSSASAAAEPEPWEVRSKAGAVAFVEHWVEVFNEASDTGQTDRLAEVSAAECKTCRNLVSTISGLYEGGGSVVSAGWQVEDVSIDPASDRRLARGAVNVNRAPQRVTEPSGEVRRFDGGRATVSYEAEWRGGRWRMVELVIL